MVELGEKSGERILGVTWDVKADLFKFVASKKDIVTTRRGVLSALSSLYDPLGFVAPLILPGKLILQELCANNFSWNDQLTHKVKESWISWFQKILSLDSIEIPRCLCRDDFCPQSRELHHFSDESENAYGDVSYLQSVDGNGDVYCTFLSVKFRLVPRQHEKLKMNHWIKGQAFLLTSEKRCPEALECLPTQHDLDIKKEAAVYAVQTNFLDNMFLRYSSWQTVT